MNAMGEATAKPKPLVSVIYVTRNGGPEFREVLEKLFGQKTSFSFEVIAIDSSSTDGTWELLGEFPQIRRLQIPAEEFRHGSTRNQAIELSKGEIIVLTVQDALIVKSDGLEKLVSPLLKKGRGPGIAGVSGRQVPPKGISVAQEFFILNSYPPTRRVLGSVPKNFGPGKIWFSDVFSAISRTAWEKVKFQDLVMSEDQGWALEVLKKGWKIIYEPEATVIHGHKRSLLQVLKRSVDTGASMAALGTSVPTVASSGNWQWLVNELKFGWQRKSLVGIFVVFCHELARFIGFQIGYQKFIPRQIKKSLSNLPWWYAERTDTRA